METNETQENYLKIGYYSSFILSILTIVAFGFAMSAIPPSGPYCPGNCMDYPFPDILLHYPGDYYWMYIAVFQLFAFVIFIVANHYIVNAAKKLYTFLSISFTLISSTVLLIAYFTQFSVVPISVMKGESDGIALITQYNEHGLFIAMEELGYISMSVALFFLAFAFTKKTKLESALRIILISQLFLTIVAFVFYTIKFGIERSYLFEVATITINWLLIIVIGILSGLFFGRKIKDIKTKDKSIH
jgi:hypothetical protein